MSPAEIATILDLHKQWLRGEDGAERADLSGANLAGADLAGAKLAYATLADANLANANLVGANLALANLARADLAGADLVGANLVRAKLVGATLVGATLAGADIEGANLAGATLAGANLTDATMPDGRKWEHYRVDHLAGICSEPEVIARALAAWGEHDWRSCPMHSALGIDGLDGIEDDERRRLVACWVALYDGGHLTVDGAVRS